MRQLDVTRENAEMIFDAIKDENPSDFYFNPIGVDNIVPKSADEVLKFMQRESGWTADNGVALYLFQNNKFIGYRRLFFLMARRVHCKWRLYGWFVRRGDMGSRVKRLMK